MAKRKAKPDNFAETLRRRAEKKAKADKAKAGGALSPEESRKMIHGLRVHEIELEMQNEELRRTQTELEALQARYFDLYDLAPVGYFVLSEQGLILEANLTAASLLGEERAALIKKPITRFIVPEDQDIYYRHRKPLFEAGLPQTCELRMRRRDGALLWTRVEATAARAADGKPACRAVISDITERKRAEEMNLALTADIQNEKTLLRTLLNSIADEVWFADARGRFTLANQAAMKEFRLDPGQTIEVETLAKSLEVFRSDGSPRPIQEAPPLRALSGETVGNQEEVVRTPNNSELRYRQVSAAPVRDADGVIIGAVSVVRDITELHQVAAALQISESRYRQLVENAQEAIVVAQDGFLKFANQTASQITGYSKPELLSRPFSEFIHPDDRKMVVENYKKRLAGETDPPRYAFRLSTRDGGVIWVEIGAVLISWEGGPASLNFLTDITERKAAEEVIRASLREKEVLLREIHHRVKNNLQLVSSLLSLQAGSIRDEDARRVLKEGQLRIRSIAFVHEKLYGSQDFSKVDFAGYLQNLSAHLFQFFQVKTGRIRLETDFEPVHLDIGSAVPCGLIVNELLTNALKYAFPEGREGALKLGLRREKDGAVELRVADDGVGLPETVDLGHNESIGLQIVTLLVGQLEGTIELDRKNGTAYKIVFRGQETKSKG